LLKLKASLKLCWISINLLLSQSLHPPARTPETVPAITAPLPLPVPHSIYTPEETNDDGFRQLLRSIAREGLADA
jgi:hypothetical protein